MKACTHVSFNNSPEGTLVCCRIVIIKCGTSECVFLLLSDVARLKETMEDIEAAMLSFKEKQRIV